MLNRNSRENNKSHGPWGMNNFNYRKAGDEVARHRFIAAPNEKGAIAQFEALMKKTGVKAIIIEIEQVED